MQETPSILEKKYLTKLLTFAILVKRRRTNSVLLKNPSRQEAKEYGICYNTFKKYRNRCIELNWLDQELNGNYRFIKLKYILSSYYEMTGNTFGSYEILKRKLKHKNFNATHEFILTCLIDDNIRETQQVAKRAIDYKEQVLRSSSRKGSKSSLKPFEVNTWRDYKEYLRNGGSYDILEKSLKYRRESVQVEETRKNCQLPFKVTSARHAAHTIGITKDKASKILSAKNELFKTKKHTYMIEGCNEAIFDSLRELFPHATVIPLPFFKKTKLCFGREIVKTGENFIDFRYLPENNPLTLLYNLHRKGSLKVVSFNIWSKNPPKKSPYPYYNKENNSNNSYTNNSSIKGYS
jgi:hypothetical protein